MQWIGPTDGNWAEDVNGNNSTKLLSPPIMREVRMAWVQSLIESGEYEGCDLLSQAIDEMLVEKFFSE